MRQFNENFEDLRMRLNNIQTTTSYCVSGSLFYPHFWGLILRTGENGSKE